MTQGKKELGMNKATILLADDDASICTVLEQALAREGYRVKTTDNLHTLSGWVEDGLGDVVITDVMMPSGNGLEMLPQLKSMRPELPVIVISAQNTLMTAVKANEAGAFDYLPKPFDLNELIACVDKSAMLKPDTANDNTEQSHSVITDELALIGRSTPMQDIYKLLARLVMNDLTVMIEGESGTGKELVARALHNLGARKSKPFVAVNMAAIPKDLVESELFGHEKGAFTGATHSKTGKFAQAHGGTLFLDEIGDMPADAQTKLLRVLQQGEFTPIGGHQPIKTNVRIVCATHHNLGRLTQTGKFREDLYYRLNVVPVRLPPLRERSDDISMLAEFFLKKAGEKGLPNKSFDAGAISALHHYHWPGNVRELENMVYRLAALCNEPTITAEAVAQELGKCDKPMPESTPASESDAPSSVNSAQSIQEQLSIHLGHFFAQYRHTALPNDLYDKVIKLVEKPLIDHTLKATQGNQLKAARILGINRNTLRKKMQQLGMLNNRSTLPKQSSGGQ